MGMNSSKPVESIHKYTKETDPTILPQLRNERKPAKIDLNSIAFNHATPAQLIPEVKVATKLPTLEPSYAKIIEKLALKKLEITKAEKAERLKLEILRLKKLKAEIRATPHDMKALKAEIEALNTAENQTVPFVQTLFNPIKQSFFSPNRFAALTDSENSSNAPRNEALRNVRDLSF